MLPMLRLSIFLPAVLSCLLSFTTATTAQPAVAEAPVKQKLELPETNDGLAGEGPIRRQDWFRNIWNTRRTKFANQTDKQGALVFLGDSITQGWGDIDKAFPGAKTANRGISGDTTRGMLLRLNQDVLSLKPSGVVLLMGTNDLEEQADPKVISANTQLIIAEIKKYSAEIPIIVCSVFPAGKGDSNKRPKEKIQAINRLNAKAAAGDPQVMVLDTYKLFANKQGIARKEEFPDMLHPNKLGYDKWVAAMRPLLETLGFLEVADDGFIVEEGFQRLFNGKDLTGWQVRATTEAEKKKAARWQKGNPNAPLWPIFTETKSYDGQTSTDDGRYIAKNGRLVVTIPPEGRKIQQLFTQREFPQDFVLKLEFRATPDADSGVFLRDKQLQCRDYVTAGPYKKLQNYKPQDWNELVISVQGNVAHCTCNGEVIEAEFKIPNTGPIGLEGDRGQIEYRRIRIKTSE